MNTNKAVSVRIARLLSEKKMTQYRLAKKSGLTHSTLKNIMHNTITDNMLSTLVLIAKGFDIHVSEFLEDELFDEGSLT